MQLDCADRRGELWLRKADQKAVYGTADLLLVFLLDGLGNADEGKGDDGTCDACCKVEPPDSVKHAE